jgi:peptide-methionine (S)-S-oxide reductase
MPHEKAILAGGCFWGLEDLIRRCPGIISTKVGYTGGHFDDPNYSHVKEGNTGHAEAIEIVFEKSVLNYEQLLRFFFKIHDPTTKNRQGNDRGDQYRSAIFYLTEDQSRTAHAIIADLDKRNIYPSPIVTEIVPAGTFYEAEDYHQDYLIKNPNGYTCHFIRTEWQTA